MVFVKKAIYWSPRWLGILFTLFIAMFAMDSWGQSQNFFQDLYGFVFHLIPAFLILAGVIIGWRSPGYGAMIFLILSVVFTIFFKQENFVGYLFLSGPLYLVCLLFLMDKFINK